MLFGSVVLEVALGMIFVYLLLSLLCSALGEYIEAKFNNRAKYLRQGITLLLNDTQGGGVDLASELYKHGLIRPLYRSKSKLPSYIPSRTFALALWNMATRAADGQGGADTVGVTTDLKKVRAAVTTSVPNSELRNALLTLIDEADGDIVRARKNIEEWYEAMMDRVSGWYKRRTAVLMLVLGVAVAALINADTITLARALAQDSALRGSVAAAAEKRLATTPPDTASSALTPDQQDTAATARLKAAYGDVEALGLPIGWVRGDQANTGDPRRFPGSPFEALLKLFGILLTGFAISQGSPFWFDLLNRFMVVRSTVKPTEKSQEQPSKERPASPAKSSGQDTQGGTPEERVSKG
jgi:hypothetical protein